MSRRRKLEKFAEFAASRYAVQDPASLRGAWREKRFANNAPLVVELGCGKGEYVISLARQSSKKNFIGVDLKGDRLWAGARTAARLKLQNACFLKHNIAFLQDCFAAREISEIWITFPDPFIGKRNPNRRLTSPFFMNIYQHVITPSGILHFKTDNTELFEYTREVLKSMEACIQVCYDDLYATSLDDMLLTIPTTYENKFRAKGETIKYIRFTLPHAQPLAQE